MALALQDDIHELLRTIDDPDAAYRLLSYGKKALPALHDFRDATQDEKLRGRADSIMGAILDKVVEDYIAKWADGRRICGQRTVVPKTSIATFASGSRLIVFNLECRCRALRHDGHEVVGILERTGEPEILCRTGVRDPLWLADADTLARHLRPVRNEKDAVAWVEALTGERGSGTVVDGGIHVKLHRAGVRFDASGTPVGIDDR
jgi:hypothetical protein